VSWAWPRSQRTAGCALAQPEFEQQLQTMADEAAFGSGGGLDVVFEEEPAYSNESD
jgi:hypothetical protein